MAAPSPSAGPTRPDPFEGGEGVGEQRFRTPSLGHLTPTLIGDLHSDDGAVLELHRLERLTGRRHRNPLRKHLMHAHREAGSRKAPADPGVMGALAGAGMSHAFVYGQYPLTVPLIVVGLAWAGLMAARANWRACGTGLAVAAVGGVGTVAGPAGAWAVAGVGLCIVLLGSAAAIAWRQRRGVVRP